jgi:uncharacterized membrane protein
MESPLHHELKKEFQLERLILFSDAVFAIAITLLVLEIRVPEIDRHVATDALLLHSLNELIPKFVGFLISFFIIGLYWTIHHYIFGFVVNYTLRLKWINLLFLLAVVLMPFSTAFYSEYVVRLLKLPVIVYVINIVFLGAMNFVLWKYVTAPRRKLTEGITRREVKYFSFRAITVPCAFVLMGLIYLFVQPEYALVVAALVPIIIRISRKFLFRKTAKTTSASKPVKSIEIDRTK